MYVMACCPIHSVHKIYAAQIECLRNGKSINKLFHPEQIIVTALTYNSNSNSNSNSKRNRSHKPDKSEQV